MTKSYFSLLTPMNLSLWWNLGSLLMFLMMTQVLLGILLSFYYEASNQSFYVITQIHLESYLGCMAHLSHLFLASFIFLVMYMHISKGLYQGSFYKFKLLWVSGFFLLLLMMFVAFMGYVLPWGQMSLWGATVITNLLSVLPYGDDIVFWIWGGFFISTYTLKLFFSIHFLFPIMLMLVSIIHLIILHYMGSSNPLGMDSALKSEFLPNFLIKDMLNVVLILFMFGLCLYQAYYFSESENFLLACYSNSPLHIKPEWYFLQFYSILRAIPNKLGGVLSFSLSIIFLGMLVFKDSKINFNSFKSWSMFISSVIVSSLMLIWLGGTPIEYPYNLMSKIFTFTYFFWFMLITLL